MEHPPELRLGSVLVKFFDDRRFVFVDLHDPTRLVTIDDADVDQLITFLHTWSKRASQKIELVLRPGPGTAPGKPGKPGKGSS